MAGVFESVNKFFGVKEKKAPKEKSQAERDDDVRFRNKFRDGPNDPPKGTKKKKKDKKAPGKKVKAAASTGLAARLRDKSKKAIEKQGG